MKQKETENEKRNARLAVLGHKYKDKLLIILNSITVRYRTIRILLTLEASLEFKSWIQAVIKAYIQGYSLQRDIDIKTAEHFKLESHIYLQLLKPVLGVSESGHSLFQKYQYFLKNVLKLEVTYGDMTFYYMKKRINATKSNFSLLHDTLAERNNEFKKITLRYILRQMEREDIQ